MAKIIVLVMLILLIIPLVYAADYGSEKYGCGIYGIGCSETPASTSSGGGGGGAVSAAVTKVSRVTMIGEGLNKIDFTETEKASVGIEEILIESSARADYAKVSIEKLTAIPAEIPVAPSPYTYSYLKIEKTILKDEELKSAKIVFTVSKKWVSNNDYNPEKVVLQRYTTDWSKLPTSLLKQDATNYYYQSTTPGFSVFAITAEKKAQTEKQELPANISREEEEPVIPAEEAPKAPEKPRKRLISPAYIALIGIIILILVIIARLKSKRRWKK